nr:(2Fe-2S)-binding protein [uncultured Desulfobulbus sp.]
MEPDERMMARLKAGCVCKGVKLIRLIEAIEHGAATVAEVQQACGIGDGACNGKRCGEKIRQLLASPKGSASMEDELRP